MSNVIDINNKKYFIESVCPSDESKTCHAYQIKELLYSKQSKYQQIDFYDSCGFGKMLVLDGIIQTTEKDEFIYHENIVHLPMFYHSNPKKVLIIGGGDGGTLREVLQHPIEHAWMVEIDGDVIEQSKKFLPTISNGAFENDKATVIVGDGKDFIKKHNDFFDIIILDLSDPDGPAEELITKAFYTDVKAALKKDGVIAVQSESLTYQPKLAAKINKRLNNVFSSVKVHQISVPTYQGSIFSLTICSNEDLDQVTLEDVKSRFDALNLNLKYYHPKIHFSSTVLPQNLQKIFE